MSLAISNSHSPYPTFEEATDPQSPIYRICLSTVFERIPREWFLNPNAWLDKPPKAWQSNLHGISDEKTLRKLVKFVYELFKNIAENCLPEARELLASKTSFDVDALIQANLEHNRLIYTDQFVNWLHPLVLALNKKEETKEELTRKIDFLKGLRCYDKQNPSIAIHRSDKLLVFLLQFAYDDEEHILQILHECKSHEVRKKLNGVLHKNKIHLPKDASPLSVFVRRLFEISPHSFPAFFKTFAKMILDYQKDNREGGIRLIDSEFLWSCGELIYGFRAYLERLPIYGKACAVLDSLSILAPPSVAIAHVKIYFPFHSKDMRAALAEKVYYCWWHHHKRLGKKKYTFCESLARRLMHKVLVEDKKWGVSREGAVQMVKELFYANAPLFPFVPYHAKCMYDFLQSAYKAENYGEKLHPNKRRKLRNPDN